eukprot:COSAG01_NODE_2196_length_8179_cov_17.030322_4_plen_1365_part_00
MEVQQARKRLCDAKVGRLRERAELVVMNHNRHSHCFSCRKSKRGKDGCRFAVPAAHGIVHARCIQLGKRERPDEHEDVRPDDVRWCKDCVVGPRAKGGPFTDEEKQQVRRRIIDRGLHYEQVDLQQLPPLPVLHETSVQAAFQHLTASDSRCLVVEVPRPCPPAGAPASTPATAAEVLGLLKQQLAAEETLHSASFDACELERRMGTEEGTEWMLNQCTAAHCDNGIVAEYCEVLSAMMECNTAVYHLGAGTNAKAASMYFSKYQVKPQYDINCDMLVVICTANEDIHRNPSRADDSGTASRMSKHLTQRIINTGAERSATEAAMICLGQPAEVTEDANTYVDAWSLCEEACKLAGKNVPSTTNDEQQEQTDGDTRERNGLMGDTGYRGVGSARKYYVKKEVKWVTTAQHYMYRNVALRHLNAIEFFQLYDVKPRAKPAKVTTDAQSDGDGRGRKRQPTYEFMREHPLSESHVCTLRAKFMLPVLTGGTAPTRPKGTKKVPDVCKWSVYYSALLVPWGFVNDGVADGHFTPIVTVAAFVGWWLTLHAESTRYAHNIALEECDAAARAQLSARQLNANLSDFGIGFSAMWKGRIGSLGKGTRDSRRRQRSVRDMLEYRLFVIENMHGAFEANNTVVNRANSHRNQSRTLWNATNIPREDRAAWGQDEVFDTLRVDRLNREMLNARQSGKVLRAALRNAANNESLLRHVFQKMPIVKSHRAEPATDAHCWYGLKTLSSFKTDACERAYKELCEPVATQRSSSAHMHGSTVVPDPFADDVTDGHDESVVLQLHPDQRAVGRNFLACLKACFAVADDNRLSAVSLCIGPAGSGKSRLIHALLAQIFAQRLGSVVCTGYTGVCCAPFLSPTLLTLCNLPARSMKDEDPTGLELGKFAARFEAVTGIPVGELTGLIIDEISFLKTEVLGRISRLFEFVRDRKGELFGGLVVLLAGHLSQLPPVGAGGTWFQDVLLDERRRRGDPGLPERTEREKSRNFQHGLAVLRAAMRFDLTHNYRAHLDPKFALCLANLCAPTCDETSVVSYLKTLKKFNAREELTKFGPFATLSNAMRHSINRQKILEWGKHHRLPVFRWRWKVATAAHIPDDVYDTEPSLWGYFCEGAPIQVTLTGREANPAKGVANGTCGNLVALRFSSTPDVMRVALGLSGKYDGDYDDTDGFITLDRDDIAGVVVRVSGAQWHGVELPDNVADVLPKLPTPRRSGIDATGCVALPLVHKSNIQATLYGTRAAYSYVNKIVKLPCSYELAFALTDYKLQGMTLERLVLVIGTYPYPLRHSLASLYVMLSRVRSSKQLRVLEGQPNSIQGLADQNMQQRDELVVFEQCYGRRRMYSSKLALQAYDALVAQRASM